MCITCKYRDTTNAKGCIAVLVPSSIDDSTIQLNILMNNSQCTALSSNTTLLVYDWEVDGGRSTWPAAREEIYISRLEQPLIIQDIPLKLLVTSIKYEQSTSLLQFNLLFHQVCKHVHYRLNSATNIIRRGILNCNAEQPPQSVIHL